MEQLIELLKQIQDLSGVAIDALQKAGGAKGGAEGKPAEGSPAEERSEPPAEAKAEGDMPNGGGKPQGRY